MGKALVLAFLLLLGGAAWAKEAAPMAAVQKSIPLAPEADRG